MLGLGVGCAAVALTVGWVIVGYLSPLEVTVRNQTGSTVGDLVLVSEATGQRTAISSVAAGRSVTVQPSVGPSEDQLSMVDAKGRKYCLLGYFEGDPGGEVTVTVTAASDAGLAGSVLDETRYSSSGESTLSTSAQ